MPTVAKALLFSSWIPPDPYWGNVRTLLRFVGGVVDSSTSAVSYALGGGAVISPTLQLFGSGCLDCRASADANCAGASTALSMAAGDFWIGAGSGLGTGLTVILDEFRHTVGVPRYTAPFTPSGPFPAY